MMVRMTTGRQWSYGVHFMHKSDNGKPNEPLPAHRIRIA